MQDAPPGLIECLCTEIPQLAEPCPAVADKECCCCLSEGKTREACKAEGVSCVVKLSKMKHVWDKVRNAHENKFVPNYN